MPVPQQMFPGSRGSTVEQAVAVEFAHVKSRASKTPSACAAKRADERAIAEDIVLEIAHMRLNLWSIVFSAIFEYAEESQRRKYEGVIMKFSATPNRVEQAVEEKKPVTEQNGNGS